MRLARRLPIPLSLLLTVATTVAGTCFWFRSYRYQDSMHVQSGWRIAQIVCCRGSMVFRYVYNFPLAGQSPTTAKSVRLTPENHSYTDPARFFTRRRLGFGYRSRTMYWQVPPATSLTHELLVPHWSLVAFPLTLYGIVSFRAAHRRRRRRRRRRCTECNYDLRESKGRCPECGTAVAPNADPP